MAKVLAILALVLLIGLPGQPVKAQTYTFTFSSNCPPDACSRSSGTEGPFPTRAACEAARSRASVPGFRVSACVASGGQPSTVDLAAQRRLAEQRRQEEARRLAAIEAQKRAEREAEQRAFKNTQSEALSGLKGIPVSGSYSSSDFEDKAKLQGIPTLAENVVQPDWTSAGGADRIRNGIGEALAARKAEMQQLAARFRTGTPPPLAPQRKLADADPGDVILVGNHEPGLAQVAQAFVEDRLFGNPNTPVTHALIYLGNSANGRLYLDNQPITGPRIIGETEFQATYGKRPLYSARPTVGVAGADLMKAAQTYAGKGSSTGYGVFGDDLVCSESALLALVRAQGVGAPGKGMTVEQFSLARRSLPVEVTPGDIYLADSAYFTVQPLHN